MADNSRTPRKIDWRFYVVILLTVLVSGFVMDSLSVGERWTWGYELTNIGVFAASFLALWMLVHMLWPKDKNASSQPPEDSSN